MFLRRKVDFRSNLSLNEAYLSYMIITFYSIKNDFNILFWLVFFIGVLVYPLLQISSFNLSNCSPAVTNYIADCFNTWSHYCDVNLRQMRVGWGGRRVEEQTLLYKRMSKDKFFYILNP